MLAHQPKWRVSWFYKYPNNIIPYAQAPRDLRVNPIYCPCLRRRPWHIFANLQKTRPMYLNYPVLSSLSNQLSPTKDYMMKKCKAMVELYQAIPDLACLMLVKICRMIIACISTFQKIEGVQASWTKFFKGSRRLCWDLSKIPTHQIITRLYSRLQFLPSHFMLTFKEAFYTGFFEQAQHSRLFSLVITKYQA